MLLISVINNFLVKILSPGHNVFAWVQRKANLSYGYSEVQHQFGHASSTGICQMVERCWMTCQHICPTDNTLEQSCPCLMEKKGETSKVTPLRSTLIRANSLVRFMHSYQRGYKFKLVWLFGSLRRLLKKKKKKYSFTLLEFVLSKENNLSKFDDLFYPILLFESLLDFLRLIMKNGKDGKVKLVRRNVIVCPRKRADFRLQLKI